MNKEDNATEGYTYGGDAIEEARRLSVQAKPFVEQDLPVLQRFGLSAGMRVVEVGCGAGTAAIAIAKYVQPEMKGLLHFKQSVRMICK